MTGQAPLPPISVIMAVYNGEQYVSEAIESVLRQTHEEFEFIIVDDASTDRTREILDYYAARDERIRVVEQKENVDQPASLNRALVEASNEWVAVFDADDVCMSHRLETQLRALQRAPSSVRVLGAHAVWMDHGGRKRGIRAVGPASVEEFRRLLKRNALVFMIHPTVLLHRSTILSLGGYDAAFGAAADVELWSRVSDAHTIISVPEPLLYYRHHPKNMSMTRFFEQKLKTRWIQARQHARRLGLPPPSLEEYRASQESGMTLRRLNRRRTDWAWYLRVHGRLARWEGRRLRTLLLRLVAVVLDPLWRIKR